MDPKSEPDAETVAFTPDSTPNERDLFLDALEIENEEERCAFLENACNGDEALRQRVEGLLNAHERTGFLEPGETVDALKAEVLADADKEVSTSGSENYEVGPEIARGGMGSIRIAEDNKLNRSVAIKVMHRDISASPSDQARFVLEAEVLAKLAHPNIVPIYDMVRENGKPLFYSMKLVKGRTLQDVLDDLRVENPDALKHYTLDRLLTIFRKVCDAMAFAHAENIIHRDLKPENFMVGEFGEVLVMDWGLSKILDSSVEMVSSADLNPNIDDSASVGATLEGSVMGTPQYMSPEQAAGEIGQMDALSDIYSLGGILYAILTLRPPVEGTDVYDVLAKVQTGNLTPITTVGSTPRGGKAGKKDSVLEAKKIKPLPHVSGGQIPSALSSVAMKALSLKKASRYRDVAAFSADIEKFQGGFATSAEQAGLGKQLMLLIKRHKALFTTAATAWAVITALAVWFVLGLRASEKKATAAEAVAVEKEAETSKALARSALSLARSATSLAEAALRESNGPAMRAALEDVPEDLRGSTWHYLFGQSDTSIARIDLGEDIRGVVAHPRLPSVFVFVTKTGKVALMNVRTGERLLEFSTPALSAGGNYDVAISPDGESIAIGQDKGGFEIHNGRNGQEIIAWESEGAHQLAFSADGRLLLQTRGRVVNLWNTSNGELRWSHDAGGPVSEALLTPDGTQVLLRSKGRNSRLLNFEDGTLIRNLGYQPPWVSTFHPGGKTLLGGERDGIIKGFDFQNDRERFKFQTDGQEIQEIVVSASGARFISVARLSDGRQAIRVWDTRTGSPLQSLLGGMGSATDASVHPLSGELVLTGLDTRVWSPGTGARWHMRTSESLRNQNNGIGFWKADELVFGPRSRAETTLLPLDGSSLDSPLRPPKGNAFNVANVSSDGRFAAVAPGLTKSPVLLLRRNGDEVEQVGTFAATFSIENLRVSPSGNHIAIMLARKGIIDLIDTATGTQPVKLAGQKSNLFNNLAWLSEERLLGLVTTGAHRGRTDTEEQIVLWDITTGEILRRVTNSGTMDALTAAPDGRRFAEAGADKNVRIRDADTLAVLKEFRVHNGPVTALAWHPKKPILATCSADLSIRLWNLETGERIDELRGPTATPLALAFSPDGQRLGCASQDSIIRIWDPPSLRDETASPSVGDDEVMDEHTWFAQSLPDARVELKPDADGWIDLLATLTPESVGKTGRGWRFEKGELVSPEGRHATVPLPGDLSSINYQMHLKLRRIRGAGIFHVGLPVGDRMTGFQLDGNSRRGIVSSLIMVNGKWGKNLPGFVEGQQINDTDLHVLDLIVRLDGGNATISVTLDAKPFYQWTGPIDALSQAEFWAEGNEPAFPALGTNNSNWAVSEVKVKRLDD